LFNKILGVSAIYPSHFTHFNLLLRTIILVNLCI